MVNLQAILDQEYPTQKEKERVQEITVRLNENIRPHFYTSLSFTHKQIKEVYGGELTLCNYLNLKKIWIVEGDEYDRLLKTKLTSLNVINCPNLTSIECWGNELTSLDLSQQVNLTYLSCWGNKLTYLNLGECINLNHLDCSNNNLTSLEFLNSLNGKKLERINVQNNNFSSDLIPFSKFINLKQLWLRNIYNQEMIEKDIYNRFTGSLSPLQKMSKLEVLSIENTDLDSGLEYLPDSIKYLWCSVEQRPQAACQILQKLLASYKVEPGSHYDCQAWRKAHSEDLIKNAQIITQLSEYEQASKLIKQSFSLKEGNFWWSKNELLIDILCNPNQAFRLWLDEKVRLFEKLKTENEQYYLQFEVNYSI